jgi:hypothetical protein
LTGNSVPEKGLVALNFCAADFLGEVLSLLGWCFLLTPPIEVLAVSVMTLCVIVGLTDNFASRANDVWGIRKRAQLACAFTNLFRSSLSDLLITYF